MINPTELKIKQLDGSNETFFIIHANEYLGEYENKALPGEHKYRIYKSEPITGFAIEFREKEDGLFITHIGCNSADCRRKNIVFAALRFIADQRKTRIFSSFREGHHSKNQLDRFLPHTMGKRWEKMLTLYPSRVQLLADSSRYVFLPKQV